ncbi:MAG: Ig-like domain-containing protein, partial [Thermoplasmata archaeon]|nr:Ig-like domain-containing protein [Thermoplasmata archaeon]
PTVDYIEIVDTVGTGMNVIFDQNVPIGFTIQGWAASFNVSAGYLGDVVADWTLTNDTGMNISTAPLNGITSTFDAGWFAGVATWTANFTDMLDTVTFIVDPPTADTIEIVNTNDTGATAIVDQTVDVGFSLLGYAAGFNTTFGYIGDVVVDWSVINAGPWAWTNPVNGESSTFNSGMDWFGGTADWIANCGGVTDTVTFTINAPTVDFIVIVDGGFDPVINQTVNVDFSIEGWAASFNVTAGYIGYVPVTWNLTNYSSANATTSDGGGTDDIFDADPDDVATGYAIWEADDGLGHTYGVNFTIIDINEVHHIEIVNTSGTGTFAIAAQTFNVGDTIVGYAAAFNDTGVYLGDIDVTWIVVDDGTNAWTVPGTGASSTFNAGFNGGTAIWVANDGDGHAVSVMFTITPPTVDYIEIVGAVDQTVPIGFTIQGWAAGFNDTSGYVEDVVAAWTVEGLATASTAPDSATSSVFDAGLGLVGGDATWTANYSGMEYSVVFTILPPAIESIAICYDSVGLDQVPTSATIGYNMTLPAFACGYNNTLDAADGDAGHGFVDLVDGTWTLGNLGGAESTGTDGTGTADSFTATDATHPGSSWWHLNYSAMDYHVMFSFLNVDTIQISYSDGSIVSSTNTRNATVGSFRIYATGYNNSYPGMGLGFVPVTWNITLGVNATGSITTAGLYANLFVGDIVGSLNVTANYSVGINDTISVDIVPADLAEIRMEMENGSLPQATYTADDTTTFFLRGYDQFGNLRGDLEGAWNLSTVTRGFVSYDPNTTATSVTIDWINAVDMTLNVTYTGANTFTISWDVAVTPGGLSYILVTPDVAGQNITADGTFTFTALGYDQYDNLISGLTFVWAAENGTIASGVFTPYSVGTWTINASVGTIFNNSVEITVTVGVLHHIVLTGPATTDADTSVTFTAVGQDQNDNPLSGLTFVWVAENGSITGGTFAPWTIGDAWDITVSVGTIDTTTTIEVTPGAVHHIVVAPATPADITADETLQFSATGYDQHNNLIPDVVFTWTSNDTDATWDATGLFNGTTVGTWSITATSGSITGTVTITVTAGAASSVVLASAGAVTTMKLSDGTLQFTAEAFDEDGNPVDGTFTWTLDPSTGGTIVNGLFTPTQGGEFTITVTGPDGVTETFTITVDDDVDDIGDDTGGFLQDYWWLLLLLIIIIVVVLLLILGKKKEEEEEEPVEEEVAPVEGEGGEEEEEEAEEGECPTCGATIPMNVTVCPECGEVFEEEEELPVEEGEEVAEETGEEEAVEEGEEPVEEGEEPVEEGEEPVEEGEETPDEPTEAPEETVEEAPETETIEEEIIAEASPETPAEPEPVETTETTETPETGTEEQPPV